MNKSMLEVSVCTTDDGKIAIQSPGGSEEWQTVIITPDQVDGMVKWLLEAKAELQGEKSD